jgi:excisionase family DNA binding protein
MNDDDTARLACRADISMNPRKRQGMGRRPAASSLSPGAELRVMTLRDVAYYLHCHYTTVYRLCRQREIPGFRLGGEWRFLKSEIDEWIAKGGGRPSGRAPAKTDGGRRGRKPKPKTMKS